MTSLLYRHLPLLAAAQLVGFLLVLTARGFGETTTLLVASSILMAGCCWASATHLLGSRAALRLVLLGAGIGWLAEQLGASQGWFFGSYTYTDVLGPRLGDVPVVIPMMWFALCYIGYVMSCLIVWQTPVEGNASDNAGGGLGTIILMSLVGATIVTCYDLGVDPYMVYKLKAWIMARTDGWWFGETVQGFAGWMTVSFTILLAFRLGLRRQPATGAPGAIAPARRHVLVPLSVYAGLMLFQVFLGYPVEARTIALFAMGFPLLVAVCGLLRWRHARAGTAQPAVPAHQAAGAVPMREAA